MSMTKGTLIGAFCACVLAGAAGSDAEATQKYGYQPRTARGTAAGEFVRKWAEYVRTTYGTPPSTWVRSMRQTFAEADLRNLQRANAMSTYEGAMAVMLGQSPGDARAAGASALSVAALAVASPAEDLIYTPVAPCRILDSRNAIGRFRSGEVRNVFVHAGSFLPQGGVFQTCGIPEDPSAVVINIVAVNPADDGFLSVYPYGSARAASSLNYGRGAIVANELVAKTATGQPFDLAVFSQASTDVVIDITGYFTMKPRGLKTVLRENSRVFDLQPGEEGFVASACKAGEITIGGTPIVRPKNVMYKHAGMSWDGVRSSWSVRYINTGTEPVTVSGTTGAICTAGTMSKYGYTHQ